MREKIDRLFIGRNGIDQLNIALLIAAVYRSGQAIWLTMPADRPPKRGAVLFRDWMLEHMAGTAARY